MAVYFNTTVKFRTCYSNGDFFTIWAPINLSRNSLQREVINVANLLLIYLLIYVLTEVPLPKAVQH